MKNLDTLISALYAVKSSLEKERSNWIAYERGKRVLRTATWSEADWQWAAMALANIAELETENLAAIFSDSGDLKALGLDLGA